MPKAKNPRQQYLFSGLIRCGKCGKNYRHRIYAHGTKYQRSIWICTTFDIYGKEVCSSQRISEEVLIDKTREVLGVDEITETVLRENLDYILVPEKHTLVYVFKDGTEKRVEWQFRSRRESWTPEMKEDARQRAILYHEATKEAEDA